MLTPVFSPETQSEYIAHYLAEQLESPDSLSYFLVLAREYEPDFLFQTMSRIKQVPGHQIKKSRAALFVWSVRRYGKIRPQVLPPDNLPIKDEHSTLPNQQIDFNPPS